MEILGIKRNLYTFQFSALLHVLSISVCSYLLSFVDVNTYWYFRFNWYPSFYQHDLEPVFSLLLRWYSSTIYFNPWDILNF